MRHTGCVRKAMSGFRILARAGFLPPPICDRTLAEPADDGDWICTWAPYLALPHKLQLCRCGSSCRSSASPEHVVHLQVLGLMPRAAAHSPPRAPRPGPRTEPPLSRGPTAHSWSTGTAMTSISAGAPFFMEGSRPGMYSRRFYPHLYHRSTTLVPGTKGQHWLPAKGGRARAAGMAARSRALVAGVAGLLLGALCTCACALSRSSPP